MTRRALASVEWWEHRDDRPYDDQDPGGVVHPNGTLVVSSDRGFLGAAAREVFEMHTAAPAATEQKEG